MVRQATDQCCRRIWEQKIMEAINGRLKKSGEYVVLRSEQVITCRSPSCTGSCNASLTAGRHSPVRHRQVRADVRDPQR
jgi:hypothetical protein